MATTPRLGFHYLTLTDPPDIAGATQTLATDAETWANRAFPVADAAARVALSGIGTGFLVFQQDNDSVWIWTDASTWLQVGAGSGGGGGGGGGSFVEGQWRASANQTLTNAVDAVLAFGTTETTSAVVTRATSGTGHKFALANTATFAIAATVRFAPGTAGSRFIELRDAAQTTGYVSSGDQGGPAAATRHFSIVKGFAAGTELVVVGSQSSGGNLDTQFQGTSPTVYRVRLTIVQLG